MLISFYSNINECKSHLKRSYSYLKRSYYRRALTGVFGCATFKGQREIRPEKELYLPREIEISNWLSLDALIKNEIRKRAKLKMSSGTSGSTQSAQPQRNRSNDVTHDANPKLKLRLKKFRTSMLSTGQRLEERTAGATRETRYFAYWPRMVTGNTKLAPGSLVRIISPPYGDIKTRLVKVLDNEHVEHSVFFADLTY